MIVQQAEQRSQKVRFPPFARCDSEKNASYGHIDSST